MFTAVRALAVRRGHCLLTVAVALAAAGLSATPALAAPQLSITMTHLNGYGQKGAHDPDTLSGETFARGSGGNLYTITVKNDGTEAAGGEGNPVEVVDHLPTGPGGEPWVAAFKNSSSPGVFGPFWQGGDPLLSGACVFAPGGVGVTCSTEQSLEPGQSYEPIVLPVNVSPEAAPPLANVATVVNTATVRWKNSAVTEEAGTQDPTTITPAVPPAIHSIRLGLEDETPSLFAAPFNHQPFTQAGGHPFENTTEVVATYTPTAQTTVGLEDKVSAAGGGLKEIEAELPAGFVGNVESAPRCPLKDLPNRECPPDTAVGFAEAGTVSKIAPGGAVARPTGFISAVWNLQPAPGHVAALGFVVSIKAAVVVEATVRSGGDYGVNVEGVAPYTPQILSSSVTICESGVTAGTGSIGLLKCRNPASEGNTRPFLTDSTECASPEAGKSAAPATSVRANSWEEPESFVSKSVYTGAPTQGALSENGRTEEELFLKAPIADESFLTGCDQLTFQPEIKFQPSPSSEGGSSQADAPTGVTLDLKVPQAAEEPDAKATPAIRKLEMTLPKGMTASPSAADGLLACTKAQFWPPENGVEPAEHREPAVPAICPPASQVGTAEVFTPLLSGAPVIEGEASNANNLTVGENRCGPGAWSGGRWEEGPEGPNELVNGSGERLALSYQWLDNGNPIAEKTGNLDGEVGTEPVAGAHVGELKEGKTIQCQVTATNDSGSSVAVSDAAVIPLPSKSGKPIEPPFAPSIPPPSGTASVGGTLTCQRGVWIGHSATSENPTPTFSYKWLRDAEEIPGAGGAGPGAEEYVLSAGDQGKVIQCQVIANNIGGTVLADSAAVTVGALPSPAPPLPGAPLKGELYVAQPECSPCSGQDAEDGKLLPLFMQIQDPGAGLIVKLHGVTHANKETGQLSSVFEDQPQTQFELLTLKLKGGPRAPLANPQSCGPAETTSTLTPWSAPGLGGLSGTEPIAGTPNATPSSSFNVDFNGAGEQCPAALPFAPSFNAGTTGPAATSAGAYTEFSLTFSRGDREQDLSALTVHMPLGLTGRIPAVQQCGGAEIAAAENNSGECPPASEIGTATALAGPGPDPFPTTGHVYFTGPTTLKDGQAGPFGIVVVTLAKAGPFNLGNVVVRSVININPNTAAVTVTSDPLPQIVSGVPVRLREVNVKVTKQGFMLNPTNCSSQQVSATVGGMLPGGVPGTSAQVSTPFGITGCKNLPFKPTFAATTQANSSKTNGASLNVKLTYPQGAYANIAKSITELPTALPSRLTTLQKACPDTVFNVNPATCPEGSVVGQAIAHTPLLSGPLVGPAYLVSHGGAKYPDLEIILQGEGVKVVLDGQTEITKGVTKTTFESLPDSPIGIFELNLPEGPHSVLGANGDLCTEPLNLPTELVGQNGAVMKQTTHIAVTGCPPTVAITKTKLEGNALLVTVKVSAKGTVRINGEGRKTTTKNDLTAGTHQIRVALTKKGRSLRSHHKKASVRVSLTVGKQAVANTAALRF
jgi:hypothetical protein